MCRGSRFLVDVRLKRSPFMCSETKFNAKRSCGKRGLLRDCHFKFYGAVTFASCHYGIIEIVKVMLR